MRVGVFEAEGDSRTEVVELEVETVEPLRLIVGDEPRGGRLGEGEVVVAMRRPGACHRVGSLGSKLAVGVLAHGLQEPVADQARAGAVELHEALVDKGPEVPGDLARAHLVAGGDGLGRGEIQAAGEHRQAGEHVALGRGEQVPGPLDHREQGLLAPAGRARAAREEGEALVEPGLELGR